MKKYLHRFMAMASSFAIFLFASSSFAFYSNTGQEVRLTGEGCKEGNVYLAGGMTEVNQDVCGDVYVVGGQVRVRSNISGDLVVGGGDVEVSGGTIEGDVRIGSGTLRFNGEVQGELLSAGGQTFIQSDSVVFGETHIAGGTLELNGTYNAPVFLYGGQVRLQGLYRNTVDIHGEDIAVINGSVLEKNLNYYAPSEATIENRSNIAGEVKYTKTESTTGSQSKSGAISSLSMFGARKDVSYSVLAGKFLFGALKLFLVAIIIAAFYYKASERIQRITNEKKGMVLLYGFLVLIATPLIAFLLLVTGVLSPFGILIGALFGLTLLFSKAMAVLYLQKQLLPNINKYLGYLIFSLAIILVCMIPFLGGLLKFAIYLFGLGVFIVYCLEKYRGQQKNGTREKKKVQRKIAAKKAS